MPRQRVVDQIVNTGWIEKSTYFPHHRSCLALNCRPQRRALSATDCEAADGGPSSDIQVTCISIDGPQWSGVHDDDREYSEKF